MIQEIFLDTNVWFSAFYGSKNCERLIVGLLKGEFTPVVSRKILDELVLNLTKKYPQGLFAFRKMLENTPPKIVRDPDSVLSDVEKYVHPKDQLIFQSAINAGVKIFVTGNLRDFDVNSIHKKYKIRVLSPKEAVISLGLDTGLK